MIRVFFAFMVLAACFKVAAEVSHTEITIGIHLEAQQHFEEFIAGRDIVKIDDFSGARAYRDVVEQILLIKALRLGGIDLPIRYIQVDHHPRRVKLMKQGLIHLSATPFWHSELDGLGDKVHISTPLLRDGLAEAGLYAHSKNSRALQIKDPSEFSEFIAVSNQNWPTDWKILTDLNFDGLYHTGQFTTMTDMLVKGRADILLAPFYNSDDLGFTQDGEKFYPIKNFKVSMPGSRHFAVSRHTTQSKAIIRALEHGLAILRERGEILKAYQQSGYINPKVTHWRVLNDKKTRDVL